MPPLRSSIVWELSNTKSNHFQATTSRPNAKEALDADELSPSKKKVKKKKGEKDFRSTKRRDLVDIDDDASKDKTLKRKKKKKVDQAKQETVSKPDKVSRDSESPRRKPKTGDTGAALGQAPTSEPKKKKKARPKPELESEPVSRPKKKKSKGLSRDSKPPLNKATRRDASASRDDDDDDAFASLRDDQMERSNSGGNFGLASNPTTVPTTIRVRPNSFLFSSKASFLYCDYVISQHFVYYRHLGLAEVTIVPILLNIY